jgi:hypothetical protein
MLFNLIIYLVVPLIFAFILYNENSRLFLIVFPLCCVIAFIINNIGITMGFWSIYPYTNSYSSNILLNIGLYPTVGTYLIYFAHKRKINALMLIGIFAIVSTIFKWIMIIMGRTVYGNGWNLYFTFITFMLSYYFGYLFYLLLVKKEIIRT